MRTQEQQNQLSKLINEAIKLDLEEADIWKRTSDRNTKFAQENAKMAERGIKTLIEVKKKLL